MLRTWRAVRDDCRRFLAVRIGDDVAEPAAPSTRQAAAFLAAEHRARSISRSVDGSNILNGFNLERRGPSRYARLRRAAGALSQPPRAFAAATVRTELPSGARAALQPAPRRPSATRLDAVDRHDGLRPDGTASAGDLKRVPRPRKVYALDLSFERGDLLAQLHFGYCTSWGCDIRFGSSLLTGCPSGRTIGHGPCI